LSDSIDVISAVGSMVGGLGAAIGLFYTAFQYKKDVKAKYYDTLSDIAAKIEDLESTPDLNSDYRTVASKYLNLFERIASFANKGFIDKEIARYFRNNFKRAMGLLEMKEFTTARGYFTELQDWCNNAERLDPSPPLLPYQNVSIMTNFSPSRYRARLGDFVTWINEDTTPHTVTSGTGPNDPNAGREFDSPKSGVLALSEKERNFSHEFSTKGVFPYFCRVHTTEVGEIVVEDDTKHKSPEVEAPVNVQQPQLQESTSKAPKDDTKDKSPEVEAPTAEGIKKLSLDDIIIMSWLASSLKTHLEMYIQIDPYTVPDPFRDEDDYNYSLIVDREQMNRIVSITAALRDPPPNLPWTKILDYRLMKLSLSKQNAATLIYEIKPKDTNNFYPFRRSGKILGYIMFAFQICGTH
jgi:plastocyanin